MRKEITLNQYYIIRNKEFKNRVKKGLLSDTIEISKYDENFVKFDKEYFMEIMGIGGEYKLVY